MTLLYISIAIAILWGLVMRFQYKQANSPYFKIKGKLKEDLTQVDFTGDWRRKQEIRAQLLWLEVVKEVQERSMFGNYEDYQVTNALAKLTEDEIRFSGPWSLDSDYHFPYSQAIISEFGKSMTESEYKPYSPESTLRVPKKLIVKSLLYTSDYLDYEEALYRVPDPDVLKNLLFQGKSRVLYFVDDEESKLPKDGPQNSKTGWKLKESNSFKEKHFSLLVDW